MTSCFSDEKQKPIKNIMETLDVSVEKAMDILKIPADQRGTFQEKINQE